VAFSANGSQIISTAWWRDSTVKVWDADDGTQLLYLRGHVKGVTCAAGSPDGSRIVSGADDSTVRVWDAHSGQQLLCLDGHDGRVVCVAWSPDGRHIVSGGWYGSVRVWDACSGRQLLCLRADMDSVESVAYLADGNCIVSGMQNSVHVWNAHSGESIEIIQGTSDLHACAAGVTQIPFVAIANGQETAIQSRSTREPVAWFPASLSDWITFHPGRRLWAGNVSNHLYLIALEGA
jgi:WD40 repeat protein